jgi:alkaline phosphatase D
MSTLRKPALGPIVGHTTHESCRLWIAASDALDRKGVDEDHRTIGVIGVVEGERVNPKYIYYFRLRREFDRTGTFNLGVDKSLWRNEAERETLESFPIKPATPYRVRMASLNLDDAYANDDNVSSEAIVAKLPPPSAWEDKLNLGIEAEAYGEAFFTTQPEPTSGDAPASRLSFLLGSCRYPGLLWKRKESDRIFGPMLREHQRARVNFTLMVGDQVYADMFNRMIPVGLADTYEEFQERYHSAFDSWNMKALLSQIPTYMILDDHEIEDNWTQDRLHQDHKKRVLFNLAIGAYMSYQWSHGPRFADSYVHQRQMDGNDRFLTRMETVNLFYDFSCAGYPFFVLDTRTQRYKHNDPELEDNHLLGKPSLDPSEPSQLDRVCAWLRHMQKDKGNIPKFIVTSSVFVPNDRDARLEKKKESDSWPAFPITRKAILETIVQNEIENVIFLSGDIHCANIAKIDFIGPGAHLTAYSITSSAFYWPFPFADGNPAGFVHDSRDPKTLDEFKLSEDLGAMHYRAWAFTQADNFCRIDLNSDASELVVQVFDSKGIPLLTRKQDGMMNNNPERLQLAEW